jgi:ATP-binding cassette subfamily B multidrug efflux pump
MPGPKTTGAKPKSARKTLFRIGGYLFRQKSRFLLITIFIFISAGASVAGNYLIKPLLNDCIVPLIGKPLTPQSLEPFARMIALMAAIYGLGVLSSVFYTQLMIKASNNTLNAVRRDLFNKMQDLPVRYFDTHTHGELMSRFTSDVDTLREAISMGVTQLLLSFITVIGTFIMMLILSPALTLLIVVMLIIMMLIIKVIGSNSSKYFKKQQKAIGQTNGYIEEMIEGQKVVKVFCHEDAVKNEFDVLNQNLRRSATNANFYANVIMPIMGNLTYINYAMTAVAGSAMVIAGKMDIGSIASFLQYTRTFSNPITQISQQFNAILAALAGAERIFEVIDEQPENDDGIVTLVNAVKDENGKLAETEKRTDIWAWKLPNKDGAVTYSQLLGDVRFENVTFGYDENKTVLQDVSLYAKPGQKIAFVGSTGAGKTTITNLINRFYEVSHGQITYDGIDIKKIKKDDLRRSLAMVLQDTHLFTGTVRENIRYGKLDATDEEIVAAAKLANADYFIRHLPQGYDTMLTSDGTNLSQGQCQLLAIARAAVADPPVLILDEATSSIDTRTEALIEKGMDKLMDGRTVFVIAHRLSTVRNSNAIMVLENGEIIERGSHNDLIEQKGKYYQLYTGQFELS